MCDFLAEWTVIYEAWVEDPGPDNTAALDEASNALFELSDEAETGDLQRAVVGTIAGIDPDRELLTVSQQLCAQLG